MATISSLGVGSGLDIKTIVSQLVALEKRPLEKLKLDTATTQAKISTFGQIRSLVATLSDAVGNLTSLTGWNGVNASSSESSFVTVSAVDGTQPTSFEVEVTALAKFQSSYSAAILPVAGAVGGGTLRLETGKWNGGVFTAGSGTPVDITVSATDTVSDIASKINGSNAGVTATVLTDVSGERLLLRGKNTGVDSGYQFSIVSDADGLPADAAGLSRLVVGSTTNQYATDAAATVNGIAVTSATNTFANSVSGVKFTAVKVTTGPVTLTVSRDVSAVQKKIEAFVKAYNDVNGVLEEATKYDASTKTGGLLQGDSATLSLQGALRAALNSVTTGSSVFQRLSDVGIEVQRGGTLQINSTKLSNALGNMSELKAMFSSTGYDSAEGIGVRIKSVTSALLKSQGFFAAKNDMLKRELASNADDQKRVNDKAARVEAALNRRYSALDAQLAGLNSLNSYLSQQIAQWNKSSS